MKKFCSAIAIIAIMGFTFSGMEYLIYGLKISQSGLFYPVFLGFLLCVVLCIEVLNRLNLYPESLNRVFTLVSVFIGLGLIKLMFKM